MILDIQINNEENKIVEWKVRKQDIQKRNEGDLFLFWIESLHLKTKSDYTYPETG